MANKAGSDGQIRKTTAQWAVDTDTYPEGMRLMDTTTGTVRVSKGTTYALAWVPSSGGGDATWGGITGTLTDQTDLVNAINVKTRHHGPYTSGLTLRYLDMVTRENQLWQWDGGTTTSTDWATDSANFGIAIAANLTAVAAVLPKRYKWIGDGGAATGTVVANTLGVTINVTNPVAGEYRFTAASGTPFTANKTTAIVQSADGTAAYMAGFELTSDTQVRAYLFDDAGAPVDPTLYQVIIEVEP